MNISMLCEKLNIPAEVAEAVTSYDKTVDYSALGDTFKKLDLPELWGEAISELQAFCGDDPMGMKILTLLMHCITYTYEKYLEKGIPEKIFIDTMGFIPRFLKSNYDTWGNYSFVWAWWLPREITMREFRVGEFEYEFSCEGERLKINVHIPSDARLASSDIKAIYPFIEEFYPEYKNGIICCDSWMLSPELKKLLPESSNIIKFQNQFEIKHIDLESPCFMGWIYDKSMPIEDLPEDTTLRKNLKQHLLGGGKVGSAYGEYVGMRM